MSAAKTILCRFLIALMAWAPFQLAHAGMIGAGQAAPAAQTDRDAVATFLARADVARELRALGLDPAAARSRAAALSDDETRAVAGELGSLPAGANVEGVVIWIAIIFLVWYLFWKKPQR